MISKYIIELYIRHKRNRRGREGVHRSLIFREETYGGSFYAELMEAVLELKS